MDYVLHVASPFPVGVPKDPDELIVPARDGVLRVLRAAAAEGVKRVVQTSSFAAIDTDTRRRHDRSPRTTGPTCPARIRWLRTPPARAPS